MSKKIKVHSLTGRMTPQRMRQAFLAVKRNRGAAGVDKVSIAMFAANLEENLAALMRDLKTGTFRPLPLRRVHIPKGPGSNKLRPLGIPVVRDRVAQEVVRRLLAPIFEPRFHDASFGFIAGRNCHQAGYHFARYADDFVVVCQTPRQAHEARALVERVLTDDLGLQLSSEKTKVTTFGKGYEFLGFFLSSRSRRMREKSVQKFKAKVRELTVRKCNLDAEAIKKLNRVIRGTANYFATEFSTGRWSFQKLDSWIRMRLRCMKRKRKNYNDNAKLRVGYFRRKLGLLTLEEFCTYRDARGEARHVIPRHGATSVGVAR